MVSSLWCNESIDKGEYLRKATPLQATIVDKSEYLRKATPLQATIVDKGEYLRKATPAGIWQQVHDAEKTSVQCNDIAATSGRLNFAILFLLGWVSKWVNSGLTFHQQRDHTETGPAGLIALLFCYILSHNLGRSSGHHRWIRNNPFLSCPVFSCPSWAGKVHSCPLFDIVFPPLLLSASFTFSFHCALYDCLC